ncbi:MAG: DUF4199 domain-containing protein [Flavobacterium sp.]|nr:DUF4199 domain-containing protein [Flavobacterium sp.]
MNEIIKKNGITFGVISGVLSILTTTIIYVVDLELFVSPWIGLISILIYVTLGVVLLSKTKKDLKGQFVFKEAFTTYFIFAVVGIVISVLFNIILFNYVDPSAKETIKELSMKMMITMMQKFNAPASAVNEALKGLKENDQFSMGNLFKGGLTSILVSSIFGLILAAIFKTKTVTNE